MKKKTGKAHSTAKTKKYKKWVFKSQLEYEMCRLLEKNKIPFAYEEITFEVMPSFKFKNESYEKFMNAKGAFKNRGTKAIPPITYTPDFTSPKNKKLEFIIETKGRANPDFSIRWKLFKKTIEDDDLLLFVPRNLKDCNETVKILKSKLNGTD